MPAALLLLALALAMAVLLAGARPAGADTPPDTNDPCIAGGHDSCHTTGVGRYVTYHYGTRWFGDYRGALPGVSGPSFCTDLGYWYPSRAYGYQLRSAAGLHNRLGGSVPTVNLNRMAYALWRFGRSNSVDQQSAMMLYVHGLMGDAQPGEVDPTLLGAAVHGIYEHIAAQASRYAGPYTVDESMPASVDVGSAVTVRLVVRAASGAAVPGVSFQLSLAGASGPSEVTSSATGSATVTVTPARAGRLSVDAVASGLPSDLPQLYVPTRGAAAGSGQRLVVAASQTISAHAASTASLADLTVSTSATPASLILGQTDSDAVTLAGAPAGDQPTVQIALYGPAASAAAVSCTGTAAVQATFAAANGVTHAPALTPPAPGYYGYQLTIAPTARTAGVVTPCAASGETISVFAQPTVHTVVSAASLSPGAALSDTVSVTGLGDQPATVTANLYGPYPAASKMTCTGAPAWTGSIPVQADGQYQTAPVTLTVPGYYVYVESIAAGGFVHAAATTCGDTAETTIVTGVPTVATQTSAATAAPGTQISDQVVVGGLGALPATVDVQLYGPYASRAAIDCSGTPLSSTTLSVAGDGTYPSAKVTLPTAGYYTFHESIAATSAYPAVTTPCAGQSETTFAQGAPALSTEASSAVIRPGSGLSDHVKVTGLGHTAAQITVDLFGPYASLAQVDCSGRPLAVRSLRVPGDGTYDSPSVTVARAGFYVFREQIAGSPLVAAVHTACADTAETSLGAPAIITGGRGPFPRAAPAAAGRPAASTPVSVQVPSLGISAPVQPATIDLAIGQLGVPADIHSTGWWRDGAAPGDRTGTVLIAGHVDSAAAGAGAFYPLRSARPGAIITIGTGAGRTIRYRVTSVQTMLKADLPIGIFTRTGAPRLALVTCGGPFDYQTGHYIDNVIVYASPV